MAQRESTHCLAISRDLDKCYLHFFNLNLPIKKVEITPIELLRLRMDHNIRYIKPHEDE